MESTLNILGKVPIKLWTPEQDLEEAARTQLENVASLPFVFKHVAVMPDVHYGKGATIGSVIATKGAVIPAAVGVDIGCGMCAVKTTLNHEVVSQNAKKIRSAIERSVPVGKEGNRNIFESVAKWKGWEQFRSLKAVQNYEKDLEQASYSKLGSLGGGNHFIEICLDTENNVWVMLHSGSRNIGNRVATIHINKAKGIMKKMLVSLPDPDLAYFAQGTVEYQNYMHDLMWCQDYAFQNRVEMMNRIMRDLSRIMNNGIPLERIMEVNCHHNYATMEKHFGEDVLLTRKGAVRAQKGDLGIIPGSMGTKSYIVRGLGNLDSFCSCSHGAGRRMSRTKAKSVFSVEDLAKQTAGVECRKDQGVLDEIPGSYKDIDEVIENQKDLVEVVAQLKQIICVKG